MVNFLIHDKEDTVGVATADINREEVAQGLFMDTQDAFEIKALQDIPLGHKIALKDHKVGDTVIKYGHDIGKVVLDQFIFSGFPLFYRELNEKGMNFAEVEKRVFGTDHAEVGLKLAQDWSFPDSLAETIRYHHKPENAKRHKALANIVYLADLLMSRFHTGLELERLNTDALASRLEAIGFSLATFAELIDHIPLRVLDSSPELALGVD